MKYINNQEYYVSVRRLRAGKVIKYIIKQDYYVSAWRYISIRYDKMLEDKVGYNTRRMSPP